MVEWSLIIIDLSLECACFTIRKLSLPLMIHKLQIKDRHKKFFALRVMVWTKVCKFLARIFFSSLNASYWLVILCLQVGITLIAGHIMTIIFFLNFSMQIPFLDNLLVRYLIYIWIRCHSNRGVHNLFFFFGKPKRDFGGGCGGDVATSLGVTISVTPQIRDITRPCYRGMEPMITRSQFIIII